MTKITTVKPSANSRALMQTPDVDPEPVVIENEPRDGKVIAAIDMSGGGIVPPTKDLCASSGREDQPPRREEGSMMLYYVDEFGQIHEHRTISVGEKFLTWQSRYSGRCNRLAADLIDKDGKHFLDHCKAVALAITRTERMLANVKDARNRLINLKKPPDRPTTTTSTARRDQGDGTQ